MMNKNLSLTFYVAFLMALATSFSFAQGDVTTSQNEKAVKYYREAKMAYEDRQDDKSFQLVEQALKKDPKFIEAYMLKAQLFTEKKQFDQALECYQKTFEINPDFFPGNFYECASINMFLGRYEAAKANYEKFLSYPRTNEEQRNDANFYLKDCLFALDAIKHPVPYAPKNLGPAINSAESEYYPGITADDQYFLFTRSSRGDAQGPLQEDFFYSRKVNGQWTPSLNLGAPINTPMNEGAPSISADGQMVVFAGCDRPGGLGSCDLYISKKIGPDKWSRPQNMGPKVNSRYWDTQPSFSSDGKTLYFVSKRPGGIGRNNADIWMTSLVNGDWTEPVNLGPTINTPGNEESPFIHPDTKTLYFTSDGRVGMGQSDIYLSRKDDNGNWTEPKDLGYPINTAGNENSLMVSGNGELAYFASDKEGGYGGLDIYCFPLYEEARPQKITYMKGKVYDARTKKPLSASFELIELKANKTAIQSESNAGNGEFLVCIPPSKSYALNVSKPGYLFYSEHFDLKEASSYTKPFIMDVPLLPIDTGMKVELRNIFFETAKFSLLDDSKSELEKLIAFLNLNKSMTIEISGHTDNVGDKKANIALSLNRAKSVYDYLVSNGIGADRLKYKGYGDAQPIASNDTPEGRQLNRRTEFKVLTK